VYGNVPVFSWDWVSRIYECEAELPTERKTIGQDVKKTMMQKPP
jgi:hypothetical protein